MRTDSRPRPQGFTLIELMVVLVIAGIVAALAYPAYTQHLSRSRRSDAMAALTVVMQAQERYRSNVSAYASTLADLSLQDLTRVAPDYQISLDGVGATPSFASGYKVTATARSSGKQANDKICKSLSVTMTGAMPTYTATGDPNNTGTDGDTSSLCWPR
ncbi:MAG: prepilin-type N-terminal cleavage/methylation domain-containing protein [Methylotenera sp.]|jgi:type IV pilus assembly protein PilE|nr:prepilin-type N-terminal cleavage/methylation domain-containing protein [Methylotenera sp.]